MVISEPLVIIAEDVDGLPLRGRVGPLRALESLAVDVPSDHPHPYPYPYPHP